MKKANRIAGLIIILILCIIFIGCTIIALEAYSQIFGRVEALTDEDYTTYFTWKEIDQVKYPREEVFFNSSGYRLQGFIYGAENNNGLVFISQGLGGTADSYFTMIMFFVDKGWRVFAYNNTGVAGSEGEGVRGLTQSVIDLDAALIYAKSSNKLKDLPVMLVGHSWGGYAVCAVLNYDHKINAVVSFAGYNNGKDVFNELGVLSVGNVFYVLSPQFWAIEKQIFGDTAKLTAVDGINKSNIPVMIVHSSDDDVIYAETTSIYAHRSKINNPNTEIVFYEGEDESGHEYVFCSKESIEYWKWALESWEKYKVEQNCGSLGLFAEFVGFDKTIANELNIELMESINEFFNNAN